MPSSVLPFSPRFVPYFRHRPFHHFFSYQQFVGGDSAQETVPLLHRLRSQNKGALFAYSIEVDESDPARKRSPSSGHDTHHLKPVHKRVVDEMIRSIDVAADFEDGLSAGTRMTWVAVKMVLCSDPKMCQTFTFFFNRQLSSRTQTLLLLSLPTSSNPVHQKYPRV